MARRKRNPIFKEMDKRIQEAASRYAAGELVQENPLVQETVDGLLRALGEVPPEVAEHLPQSLPRMRLAHGLGLFEDDTRPSG